MRALAQGDIFLFAGFHLDWRGLFRRDEHGVLAPVTIGGRALDLLGVLVERHGEILSKAEIITAVWLDRAVEDGNLTFQIAALRRILDQRRPEGSCIQTVARRGYRFLAEVTRVERESSPRPERIYPTRAAGPPARLSIVVLPFTNLSKDPHQDYFADSITEDLTTDISRIIGSFVIARSTAFNYKDKPVDARQIGRELGVRYVLEGSVRCSSSGVRINAQLIDAETGGHLWAERLETDQRSLAETEDEIIGRLAHTLNLELVADADRHIRRERAADPDAHDLVMRGWAEFYRPRSVTTLREARAVFVRALELLPRSVRARIGLATVIAAAMLGGWSRSLADDQARIEGLLAEVFARRANHSMAYYAMAMLRRSQKRLVEGRIEAERAVALDHNNSAALYELGRAQTYLGEPEAAIPYIEKAIRLSPHDPLISAMRYGLGRCHLFLGHLDRAIELFQWARAEPPSHWNVHMWLAGALALNGDIDAARAVLAEARKLKPEIGSQACWRVNKPWITIPQYWALREKTLNVGLSRAGFPDGS
jgi:TolB-like protein